MTTIITLMTNGAFTVFLLGLAKLAYDRWEKKHDTGQAKIERVISEIEEQNKQLSDKVCVIESDVEKAKRTDLVLLHDRIWQAFRVLSKREEIGVIDRANIEYLYEEYTEKGGNHKAEVMMDFIKTIPVTPEENEYE